jgi:hypothetical protein
MSQLNPEQFPGYDVLPDAELVDLRDKNSIFQEAKYQGDVAVFRSDVLQELIKHGAYTNGFGWALYSVGNTDPNGSLITVEGEREILISIRNVKIENNNDSLSVRILVNQRFHPELETLFYLIEDSIVDEDYDAQYHTTAANINDGQISVVDGSTPIFQVRDGELYTFGVKSFPFICKIPKDKDDPDKGVVIPFGYFQIFEDRMYAFEKAVSLFAEVSGKVPVAIKTINN